MFPTKTSHITAEPAFNANVGQENSNTADYAPIGWSCHCRRMKLALCVSGFSFRLSSSDLIQSCDRGFAKSPSFDVTPWCGDDGSKKQQHQNRIESNQISSQFLLHHS
jgi:hypothetical protein